MEDPQHVCPWWLAFSFDNPVRRLFHRPQRIFADILRPGMTVADIGCGMGYFSLGMARLVAPGGKVWAVDMQPRMLARVVARARKAGLAAVIAPHLCRQAALGMGRRVDFALAFWMVHEIPDPLRFFEEVRALLKPGGCVLVAEPRLHVAAGRFGAQVALARQAGLTPVGHPAIAFSRAVLLKGG